MADVAATADLLDDAVATVEVALLPAAAALLSATFSALSLMDLSMLQYPPEATVEDGQCFDYIVVGAGSAGCVVANRLSECNCSVLLIEAGGDPPVDSVIPGLYPFLEHGVEDWGIYSEDDHYSSQATKKKKLHMTRGKVLGGCSSFNYMAYVRGNEHDYNSWLGEWDELIHYFKKSERMNNDEINSGNTAALHNTTGPMGVTMPEWENKREEYFNAFMENGRKYLKDTNGYEHLGYSRGQFTIDNKIRQSTAAAFLSPIKDRNNLFLLKHTRALKVIFDGVKAVGVEVKLKDDQIIRLCANKEVILSAGTIHTPQLLMLSGIGPQDHLKENNIEVLIDSPYVGQNLIDHQSVLVTLAADQNVLSVVENAEIFTNLDKVPTPIIQGLVALNESQGYADYQATVYPFPAGTFLPPLLCTYVLDLEDQICEALAAAGQRRETLSASLSLLHPESRGQVRLKSNDPEENPLLYLGYYSDPNDLERHALYMADYVSVLNTTYFKSVDSYLVDFKIKQCEHLELGSHEYWKCHVLNTVHTVWHIVGTCKMGSSNDSVVDEKFRVNGVERLRVVDGSVFVEIPSANTNAPIIMLAEKASDVIKEDSGVECGTNDK